jgi:hypothetical protein
LQVAAAVAPRQGNVQHCTRVVLPANAGASCPNAVTCPCPAPRCRRRGSQRRRWPACCRPPPALDPNRQHSNTQQSNTQHSRAEHVRAMRATPRLQATACHTRQCVPLGAARVPHDHSDTPVVPGGAMPVLMSMGQKRLEGLLYTCPAAKKRAQCGREAGGVKAACADEGTTGPRHSPVCHACSEGLWPTCQWWGWWWCVCAAGWVCVQRRQRGALPRHASSNTMTQALPGARPTKIRRRGAVPSLGARPLGGPVSEAM